MSKFLTAILSVFFLSQINRSEAQTVMNNEMDSLSYAIGINIGQSLKAQNLTPNTVLLGNAINDLLTSNSLAIPADECASFIQNYFQNAAAKVGNANLAAGMSFLENNKTRAGVVVTETGLQYEILITGTGAKPLATDKVKVHYHGTLIDGTVFDSSVDRGTPATFGVSQVIQGWIEGLQLMSEGSKWKFFIPENLAYGPRGQGKIGPNSALIFEVELIEIVK